MKHTGSPFAGKMWSRITVPGIAMCAVIVETGESGTVSGAIDVPMG